MSLNIETILKASKFPNIFLKYILLNLCQIRCCYLCSGDSRASLIVGTKSILYILFSIQFCLILLYSTDRMQRKGICLRLLCATNRNRNQICVSELYYRQFLIVYFTTTFWFWRKVPLLPSQHVISYRACVSIPHLAPSLPLSRDSSTLLITFILFQPQAEKFQSGIWTAVHHT